MNSAELRQLIRDEIARHMMVHSVIPTMGGEDAGGSGGGGTEDFGGSSGGGGGGGGEDAGFGSGRGGEDSGGDNSSLGADGGGLSGDGSVDFSSPSYITIAPDGSVTADFTGVINAQGVVLPAYNRTTAGQSTFGTTTNQVVWERQSDGAILATALGSEDAAGIDGAQPRDRSISAAYEATAGNQSSAELMAVDHTGAVQSFLATIQQGNGASSSVFASAGPGAGFVRTILNKSNQSDFLSLSGTRVAIAAYGTVLMTWPGGNQASNTFTITHNLNLTTRLLQTTCRTRSDGGSAYAMTNTVTNNAFNVTAIAGGASPTPAANVTGLVDWLVICGG